jgi:hypothetical protein
MSKNQHNSKGGDDYSYNDTSNVTLNYGQRQGHMNMSPSPSGAMMTDDDSNLAYQMQKDEMKRAKKEGLDHLYKQDYQPAKFAKAVEYRNFRSYMKKLPSGHYVPIVSFSVSSRPSKTPTSSSSSAWAFTSTCSFSED